MKARGLLAGAALAVGVTRSIVRPLKTAEAGADRFAQGDYAHRLDDTADDEVVAEGRRLLDRNMAFEQGQVARVRLPEDVGDVARDRHDADRQVDHEIDDHTRRHHARNPHAMRMVEDHEPEQAGDEIARARNEADNRVPAEAQARAGNTVGLVEQLLPRPQTPELTDMAVAIRGSRGTGRRAGGIHRLIVGPRAPERGALAWRARQPGLGCPGRAQPPRPLSSPSGSAPHRR